jgi:hypothetical protein
MVDRSEILDIYKTQGATAAALKAGVSKRTVQRWAAKARATRTDLNSGYKPPIRGCPSAAEYARGCRCPGCTEANRIVQRGIKERRVARYRAGLVTITHGVGGYSNWDCRCAVCREAWRNYLRARRNRRPVE